jgi:FkbM family methyltransferase
MNTRHKHTIIAGVSSDIGLALAERWLGRDWQVAGTYRRESAALDSLVAQGAMLFPCDFTDVNSVDAAAAQLSEASQGWDALVLCSGSMEPIGPIETTDFDKWERAIALNLTNQLRLLAALLKTRRKQTPEESPAVIFFAGGGVNSAPTNYSAYTVAKVALVKACELLDAEMPDVRFSILGPGWVRTKIHDETLAAGTRACANYQRTIERLETDKFTPMNDVLDCCDWILDTPRDVIGGRNFSVADDPWRSPSLATALRADPALFKLRRKSSERDSGADASGSEDGAILGRLIEALPQLSALHVPGSKVYEALQAVARQEVARLFSGKEAKPQPFPPFGTLVFPYVPMGAIDSLDLFGLDELIAFSFYLANSDRYRRALDLGANLGLHSLVLARCGFAVRAYEPDPTHYDILCRNLKANDCATATPINAAISTQAGTMEFVRVMGNTTGSHLAGAKPNPYGELERFPVRVDAYATAAADTDLVKMDIEGHEAAVLTGTTRGQWTNTDAWVEIGSAANATAVFEHFGRIGVGLFAQKIGWKRVGVIADMPTSYRDGSLFISCSDTMPWGDIGSIEGIA